MPNLSSLAMCAKQSLHKDQGISYSFPIAKIWFKLDGTVEPPKKGQQLAMAEVRQDYKLEWHCQSEVGLLDVLVLSG